MASASTVWSTYELLEQILLHLPLRALLLAQRGNKASLDVIGRSQSIQRALWLEASTTDTSEWQELAKRGITGNEISPIVNPFAEFPGDKGLYLSESGKSDVPKAIWPTCARVYTCVSKAILQDTTNFGKMLVVHPPPSQLTFDGESKTYNSTVTVTEGSGVRFEKVCAELLRVHTSKRAAFRNEGGEYWAVMPGTFGTLDTITGYEMLDVLSMTEADREGLVDAWWDSDDDSDEN